MIEPGFQSVLLPPAAKLGDSGGFRSWDGVTAPPLNVSKQPVTSRTAPPTMKNYPVSINVNNTEC